jgi:hypothetical protein
LGHNAINATPALVQHATRRPRPSFTAFSGDRCAYHAAEQCQEVVRFDQAMSQTRNIAQNSACEAYLEAHRGPDGSGSVALQDHRTVAPGSRNTSSWNRSRTWSFPGVRRRKTKGLGTIGPKATLARGRTCRDTWPVIAIPIKYLIFRQYDNHLHQFVKLAPMNCRGRASRLEQDGKQRRSLCPGMCALSALERSDR